MTINHRWILDAAGEPVLCSDLQTWALWFESSAETRRVNLTNVGRFRVSTVFLSLDHAWPHDDIKPLIWETMVFIETGLDEVAMDRCSGGRAEAQAMHDRMVERVKGGEFDHELQAIAKSPNPHSELARLREQNSMLTNEVGKRQDDCAVMTGQIRYLREQNRQLRRAWEVLRDTLSANTFHIVQRGAWIKEPWQCEVCGAVNQVCEHLAQAARADMDAETARTKRRQRHRVPGADWWTSLANQVNRPEDEV